MFYLLEKQKLISFVYGQPVKERTRCTDTYVKRNGRWQVVALRLSDGAEEKIIPR